MSQCQLQSSWSSRFANVLVEIWQAVFTFSLIGGSSMVVSLLGSRYLRQLIHSIMQVMMADGPKCQENPILYLCSGQKLESFEIP